MLLTINKWVHSCISIPLVYYCVMWVVTGRIIIGGRAPLLLHLVHRSCTRWHIIILPKPTANPTEMATFPVDDVQRETDPLPERDDKHFWSRIYKQTNSSGGPYINGWIITLFSYLKSFGRHPPRFNNVQWEKSWKESCKHGFGGVTSSSIPSGVMETPFKWQYFDKPGI